jgi:hypothetical protein
MRTVGARTPTGCFEWLKVVGRQGRVAAAGGPNAACFYARFAMERAVHWVYRYDPAMGKPGYKHTLNTLIDYFTQSGVKEESLLVRSPF